MTVRSWEITKREALFSIVIICVIVALGFIISTNIQDRITESNDKYFKALKVDNDEETFKYVIKTEVGNVLSYGVFQANAPVTDDLIEGDYFSIIKIEEHYVMKTRQVSYKCGDNTCWKTETYWEWEEVGRKRFNTDTFTYLGDTYDYSFMKFNFHKYHSTKTVSLSKRYVFRVIPVTFNGSIYSYAKGKTIADNEIFYEKNIEQVITSKEKEADTYNMVFWIVWILISGFGIFAFVYADNKWLHKN